MHLFAGGKTFRRDANRLCKALAVAQYLGRVIAHVQCQIQRAGHEVALPVQAARTRIDEPQP